MLERVLPFPHNVAEVAGHDVDPNGAERRRPGVQRWGGEGGTLARRSCAHIIAGKLESVGRSVGRSHDLAEIPRFGSVGRFVVQRVERAGRPL